MDQSEYQHPQQQFLRFRRRIWVAGIFVAIAFSLVVARFVYLQVIHHDYYQTKAEDNRISLVPVTPNRGVILDRNGVILAHNYSVYTAELTPAKCPDVEATVQLMTELIEVQPKDMRRFRRLMEDSKSFASIPIRSHLSDEEVARIIANRFRLPGVEIKARAYREYPYGELASHALGYIGRINQKERDKIDDSDDSENYRGTEHIGKAGVEQSYERELHGQTGFEQMEVDAGGRAVRSLNRIQPVDGNNLYLSLDIKLQEIAEQALGDRRGSVVAIDTTDGGVLALVSKPGFDPNLFVDGIDVQNWNALNTSPDRPLLNRALNGTYPPGSTFKPFMALAALEYGKRTPQQAISDPGYFWFGGHKFRDDKEGGHGWVDMYKSIVQSCDTYYYILANDLGIDNIAAFMSRFGFGSRTGIDLENESAGVLPSPEWKRRKMKQKKWFAGETVSIAIGQGYNNYTPLQLAQATAILANNGVIYKPHLVQSIQDLQTGEKRAAVSEEPRKLDLRPEHLETIRKALVGVNREGTSASAFAGAGYVAAGKTGTAQVIAIKQNEKYDARKVKELHRDHAWFIAFAPADKPRIAVSVIVENGGFGAQAAAPVARKIMDYHLLGRRPAGSNSVTEAPEHQGVAQGD